MKMNNNHRCLFHAIGISSVCIMVKNQFQFIIFMHSLIILGSLIMRTSLETVLPHAQYRLSQSGLLEAHKGMPELTRFQSRCIPEAPQKYPKSKIDYQIVCVWPPGNLTGVHFIFGYINPIHVNRNDLLDVVGQLKKLFPQYHNMHVSFWDNKEDAEYYGGTRIDDFSGFEMNIMVSYRLIRKDHREYLEFTSDKSKPKVKINLKSPRRK